MQENKFRELLQSKKATRAKPISFESTADNMKRIIEYAKSKKKKAHNSHTSGSEELFKMPKMYEQQHRYEIRVDDISDIFDGGLEEAKERLIALSTNIR